MALLGRGDGAAGGKRMFSVFRGVLHGLLYGGAGRLGFFCAFSSYSGARFLFNPSFLRFFVSPAKFHRMGWYKEEPVAATHAHASATKPLLRGVSHQIAFFVALVVGIWLVQLAPLGRARLFCGIYCASMCLLFGTSAVYHRIDWKPGPRAWMRRLDHVMVLVLIAGTSTAVAGLSLPEPSATQAVTVMWALALAAAALKLVWIAAPKPVVAALFLAMGWAAAGWLPPLLPALGAAAIGRMVLGGALYSLGALAYALRRPDPWPRVFGYHEVLHALVIAAAACFFWVVAADVLPHYRRTHGL